MITLSEPRIQIVQIGQTVRFDCNARPTINIPGPMTVSWAKEQGILPDDRARDDGRGVLIITQVQSSDSGTYVCTATAGQFVVTDRAQLSVGGGGDDDGSGYDSPPAVVVNPQYRQVASGQRVSFTCEAEGRPRPEVSWSRPGGRPLGYGVNVRGNVLDISSASEANEGSYICRATNRAGSREAETVLYVEAAGDGGGWGEAGVSVSPEDVVASVGDTVTLTCGAQSPGQFNIVWSKFDDRLSSSCSQDNGVLTIPRVEAADSGIYICTVTGEGGISQETRARVSVQEARGGPPTASISPEYRTIGQGETVEIVCLTSGDPPPSVTWSRVGGDLPTTATEAGNMLVVRNAQVEDRGMYLCTADSSGGSARASAILEVEPREAPSIEIFPSVSQTISTGGSVLYQCRARSGIPSPTITWSRLDRRPMPSNVEILSGGVIRMIQVTGVEEGQYRCTAENIAGKVEAVATLTIHQLPSVQLTPSGSVSVNVGSPLNIRCVASGDPLPTISWKKIGRSSKTLGTTSPTLQISSVSKEDEGTYSCVATNIAGEMEERVQVIVTEDDYNPGVNIPEDPRGGQYPGGSFSPDDGTSYVVELGNNVQITGNLTF